MPKSRMLQWLKMIMTYSSRLSILGSSTWMLSFYCFDCAGMATAGWRSMRALKGAKFPSGLCDLPVFLSSKIANTIS
jgi:hypothetical protein